MNNEKTETKLKVSSNETGCDNERSSLEDCTENLVAKTALKNVLILLLNAKYKYPNIITNDRIIISTQLGW